MGDQGKRVGVGDDSGVAPRRARAVGRRPRGSGRRVGQLQTEVVMDDAFLQILQGQQPLRVRALFIVHAVVEKVDQQEYEPL